MIVPILLCGGSGTRLWPLSRKLYPKQFLSLAGKDTLLQQTASRAGKVSQEIVVVCNEDNRFLVKEQLEEIGVRDIHIILEPEPKNTAPATAIAAFYLQAKNRQTDIVILPADHLIEDDEGLLEAIQKSTQWTKQGKSIIFGVPATVPETGYGYIKRGKAIDNKNDIGIYHVDNFVEKPNLSTAKELLQEGGYYWNSGIFAFGVDSFLNKLKEFNVDIYNCCQQAVSNSSVDENFVRVDSTAFSKSPTDSIDYAIMEKDPDKLVIPLDAKWSDIGSWCGLNDVLSKDNEGNVTKGDVVIDDVKNSYINSHDRLVTVIGVENLVIVETSDAILVTDKKYDQRVGSLVKKLKQDSRPEVETHTIVYRPWGSYQNLDKGDKFQVKRLLIKPGASISLQLHKRRSEHWVVVKGEARVTKDEETFTLKPNQSTYIPIGTKHKLENPGISDLEVVEVQTGEYLEEDDIVRFEDMYGRA